MKAFILGVLSTGIVILLILHITGDDKQFAKVFMRDMCDTVYKRDTVFMASPLPYSNTKDTSDVKPGQVWIYHSSDPFDNSAPQEQLVIAVKDGWVKYSENGYIQSHSISWFKADAHLKN